MNFQNIRRRIEQRQRGPIEWEQRAKRAGNGVDQGRFVEVRKDSVVDLQQHRLQVPRYAVMTAGSLITSSGVPLAIISPESST